MDPTRNRAPRPRRRAAILWSLIGTAVVLAIVWTLYSREQVSAQMAGLVTGVALLPDLLALAFFVGESGKRHRQAVAETGTPHSVTAQPGPNGFWREVDHLLRTEDVKWQERLDTDGEVLITQPWIWNSVVLACWVGLMSMFTIALVSDPPTFKFLVTALLGISVPTALLVWWILIYRTSVLVTREGVSFTRGPVVPFADLSGISARLGNLHITRPAYEGEWLPPWTRKSRRKTMMFNSGNLNANPYLLADWLLKLCDEAACN